MSHDQTIHSMDNQTLNRLFEAGAVLLVLDTPPGQLEFGIDINCWTTGPRFKGVKLIPPGPHLVYYTMAGKGKSNTPTSQQDSNAASLPNNSPSTGKSKAVDSLPTEQDARVGFWHFFQSGEVVVMKWNAYNEELELEKDKDQILRYKAGIREFEPALGAYPLMPPESTYPVWLKLTDKVSHSTLKSIFLADGFVDAHDDHLQEELARAQKLIQREQEAEAKKKEGEVGSTISHNMDIIMEGNEDEEADQPTSSDMTEGIEAATQTSEKSEPKWATSAEQKSVQVFFTPISLKNSFRKGAVGEEVTKYSLDKSWLLNEIFKSKFESDVGRLIGEFEAAFLTMLLVYHMGAFRQWKTISILVCQSREAVTSPNYTQLFKEFIMALESQLTSIPSSFFMDLLFATPDESDVTANFLETCLKSLARNIQSGLRQGYCRELAKPMNNLQKSVKKNFEWELPGDFKNVSALIEVSDQEPNVPASLMEDEDDDYLEEGEYAPTIVEL
ncbi:a1-alpha2 repression [Actinomortierella ambigua]|nr:a1-alpha2 repression [Actinomortierella ambigua]